MSGHARCKLCSLEKDFPIDGYVPRKAIKRGDHNQKYLELESRKGEITRVYNECNANGLSIQRTADILGMPASTLLQKLAKWGVRVRPNRGGWHET